MTYSFENEKRDMRRRADHVLDEFNATAKSIVERLTHSCEDDSDTRICLRELRAVTRKLAALHSELQDALDKH